MKSALLKLFANRKNINEAACDVKTNESVFPNPKDWVAYTPTEVWEIANKNNKRMKASFMKFLRNNPKLTSVKIRKHSFKMECSRMQKNNRTK